ncbi:Transcriptional regulatory protein KdpE [subsurface metagenome]
MPSRKVSVLVVDDDVRILRMMRRILELEGYQTFIASNGEAALTALDEQSPNLLLLDIMMPDMDGYDVCRRIREFSQLPIIMVTAKGNDEEKIEGLDAGADDYVTKPFSSTELAARVRAVLRRTKFRDDNSEPTFHSNELTLDFAHHRVTLHNEEVNLTATEYRLLSYLTHNAGRVVTPDQILEKVWGEEYIGEYHILRVSIARLRQKLGDDPKKPRFIATKIGIGYIFLKHP